MAIQLFPVDILQPDSKDDFALVAELDSIREKRIENRAKPSLVGGDLEGDLTGDCEDKTRSARLEGEWRRDITHC